ncbi:hypothetical protein T484DRAFT_1797465 [Baffinella frigidus]|nr:hypothetical protein T484DRAFT_1797465 [Cryptophyta sp. CCMP2293]
MSATRGMFWGKATPSKKPEPSVRSPRSKAGLPLGATGANKENTKTPEPPRARTRSMLKRPGSANEAGPVSAVIAVSGGLAAGSEARDLRNHPSVADIMRSCSADDYHSLLATQISPKVTKANLVELTEHILKYRTALQATLDIRNQLMKRTCDRDDVAYQRLMKRTCDRDDVAYQRLMKRTCDRDAVAFQVESAASSRKSVCPH